MGAYCLLGSIPSHTVSVREIMEVRWFDYHGPIIFGDREEIACIPHAGCRLEIVATPPSSPRKVNLLLPGQVIRYTHSFFLGDRFELPGEPSAPCRVQTAARVKRGPSAPGGRRRPEEADGASRNASRRLPRYAPDSSRVVEPRRIQTRCRLSPSIGLESAPKDARKLPRAPRRTRRSGLFRRSALTPPL